MSREYPYPPRMMTRARAAHYCDMSETEFQSEVDAGMLPGAVTLGRKPRWSRRDLDERLDRIDSGESGDWRAKSKFYGKRNAA